MLKRSVKNMSVKLKEGYVTESLCNIEEQVLEVYLLVQH